jgi:arginine/lysine/ornithine decarboxylase
MKRLRQTQQQYEQDLISKGIIPYTTEEAIKQYAEQRKTQIITDKTDANNSNRVNERITLIYSNKKSFYFSEKLFNGLCIIRRFFK